MIEKILKILGLDTYDVPIEIDKAKHTKTALYIAPTLSFLTLFIPFVITNIITGDEQLSAKVGLVGLTASNLLLIIAFYLWEVYQKKTNRGTYDIKDFIAGAKIPLMILVITWIGVVMGGML